MVRKVQKGTFMRILFILSLLVISCTQKPIDKPIEKGSDYQESVERIEMLIDKLEGAIDENSNY